VPDGRFIAFTGSCEPPPSRRIGVCTVLIDGSRAPRTIMPGAMLAPDVAPAVASRRPLSAVGRRDSDGYRSAGRAVPA
jgi:hypothetical protein